MMHGAALGRRRQRDKNPGTLVGALPATRPHCGCVPLCAHPEAPDALSRVLLPRLKALHELLSKHLLCREAIVLRAEEPEI
jgi:hypothetical protein